MPKRDSRDGSKLEPSVLRLEERFSKFFRWFKVNFGTNKVDVVRDSVEEYFVENGGNLENIKNETYSPEKFKVTIGNTDINSYTKGSIL